MATAYTNEKSERELLSASFFAALRYAISNHDGAVVAGHSANSSSDTQPGRHRYSSTSAACDSRGYIIVMPTLSTTFLPAELPTEKPLAYVPTWVEWAITAVGFACFGLFYLVFSKFAPVVSLSEMQTKPNKASSVKSESTLSAESGLAPLSSIVLSTVFTSTPDSPRTRLIIIV